MEKVNMNKHWKQSRAGFVLALLCGTTFVACSPAVDCVEVPEGLVVSDIASGKVEANPLPRCKTDWARPIASIVKDSEVATEAPAEVSPVSPEPPVDNDEISTADTSRADADGNGITGQSAASVPDNRNMGASSSSQSATQSTTAAARTGGGAVSASAIDNGAGVSISKDENGRLSVTFVGQDD